jgi:glycosyltransferase involved in cell wall biosynthesis
LRKISLQIKVPVKILMLLNAPYPADIRVKKETGALLAAGFEIFLLCLRKRGESYAQDFEGIRIIRIDAGKSNYQLAFWDVVISINFVHPKFRASAKELIRKEGIKVVHVHDLPLAGTALSLKKELDIKVILDMHENYPEALKTWFKWKRNPLAIMKNYLFLSPARWDRFEKIACQKADYVIAVVDEMKNRIVHDHSIEPDKITVVTNTEDKSFVNQPIDRTVYKDLAGKFIITYSGGIGPHRGVDVAIKGMKWLKDNPKIQLVIVGNGSQAVMKSLIDLVLSLNLSTVHFLGYQPFSKFYSYMHLTDVNVIPHQSNGHTDNTIPHKLFQGMMAGKPLLVSSSAPLKRLVEKYRSGLVFEAGNDKDFARKAEELFNNQDLSMTLGQNGRRATVEGTLNWDEDQLDLVNLYKSIA